MAWRRPSPCVLNVKSRSVAESIEDCAICMQLDLTKPKMARTSNESTRSCVHGIHGNIFAQRSVLVAAAIRQLIQCCRQRRTRRRLLRVASFSEWQQQHL